MLHQIKSFALGLTFPLKNMTARPIDWLHAHTAWLSEKSALVAENEQLRAQNTALGARQLQTDTLRNHLSQLEALQKLPVSDLKPLGMANVISSGKDAFSDKALLDRGQDMGIKGGEAVIDGYGLVGQVTSVQAHSAEVTFARQQQMVIPVMVARTGSQTLLYGEGNRLGLRYFPSDADLKPGDILVTSGVDSVYAPGIPVAQVSSVSKAEGTPYFRVLTNSMAHTEFLRYVMVLPLYRPEAVALIEAAKPPPEVPKKGKTRTKKVKQ